MKKHRIISLVLVVLMVLSLSACYNDNQGIIDVTDKYMQAIISLDREEIAEYMDYDTAVDDVFISYDAACDEDKNYEFAYEAIAESIIYEIDEKSIESSTKKKTASCDVTIHIVDYREVFAEVDKNDGNIDDYIDALENADDDDSFEIQLSFEYVYRGGKWLIKDKRAKNLREIYSFFSDVQSYHFYNTFIERIEDIDKIDSGRKYTIYDEDFNDYIIEARWWDYDSTMDKPGVYTSDTKTLAFSIEVNEDAEDEIYYAYYYSKDKKFDQNELSKPLFSNVIFPEEYGDGRAFYNIDCSKNIQKGYYVVVIASDDSLKRPFILANAEVR